MKKTSIIVPCFNEQDNINDLYNEIKKVTNNSNNNYELIFVDDGSKDETTKMIKKLTPTENIIIKLLSFSRNFGKESAMYAGLVESSGDYVCIIDADLQQNPKYIIEMEEYLSNNKEYDCITLFQKSRKENFIMKFFKKSFYKLINKISEVEFVSGASDFRMFRRNMVEAILQISEKNRFSKGIFSWVGFNNYYLPYEVSKRNKGSSKWNFSKLFKYAISGIISFSTAPIKIATFLGFVMSLLSIIYLIVVIIQKLAFGIAIAGYATIVALILLIGGIQLFCIGIIGEYLARTYIETKNRPIYLLREKYVKGNERK